MDVSAATDLLFSPAFQADPYPVYARLRAEAPVLHAAFPTGQEFWLVTRYEDVITVLRDPRFARNIRQLLTPEHLARVSEDRKVFLNFNRHMLSSDPPDHTRLRALVSSAFTPARIEALRPRIQAITDGLLDTMAQHAEVDLLDSFAFPLPITVIAELLGIPDTDRDQFRVWTSVLLERDLAMDLTPEVAATVRAFDSYLRTLVANRRAAPGSDLISALIVAEDQNSMLTEDELAGTLFLLLVAGHETTVNLIGNGLLALLTHSDQLRQLQADPTLLRNAIEEMLRFNGPVERATPRFTREDVVLAGVTIPRGAMVLAALGSADHDPHSFANPEEFDILRTEQRHIAFGYGIHYCLGAPLARLEGQIAFSSLLQRFPQLQLACAPHELQWRPAPIVRGLRRLPVKLR